MRRKTARQLALWGGALGLWMGASPIASAQDSKTNPDAPRTTQDAPRNPADRPLRDELPPVPESASDPAPPGTRGVRVDDPKIGAASPSANAEKPRRLANVVIAEGVVTRLDRSDDKLNGELTRFAFDPGQDWDSYIARGAEGVPDKKADRPRTAEEIKEANAKPKEEGEGRPALLEMVITKRTYVYTHARTEDGTDQYGLATSASPTTKNRNSAPADLPRDGKPTRPLETNFTNIKEGSFVSVRYRKVGDVNEVLNLTLIERPLLESGEGAGRTGAAPGAGGTVPVPGTTPASPPTTVGPALPR